MAALFRQWFKRSRTVAGCLQYVAWMVILNLFWYCTLGANLYVHTQISFSLAQYETPVNVYTMVMFTTLYSVISVVYKGTFQGYDALKAFYCTFCKNRRHQYFLWFVYFFI